MLLNNQAFILICIFEIECLGLVKHNTTLNYLTYLQVQTQLLVTERSYCDYIVWTPKLLIIDRIYRDEEFLEDLRERATSFFENVILLELTGRYFTRQISREDNPVQFNKTLTMGDKKEIMKFKIVKK